MCMVRNPPWSHLPLGAKSWISILQSRGNHVSPNGLHVGNGLLKAEHRHTLQPGRDVLDASAGYHGRREVVQSIGAMCKHVAGGIWHHVYPKETCDLQNLLVATNELQTIINGAHLDPSLSHETHCQSQVSHVELKDPAKGVSGQGWLLLESENFVLSEVGKNVRFDLGLAQNRRGDNMYDVLSFMPGSKVDAASLVSGLVLIIN